MSLKPVLHGCVPEDLMAGESVTTDLAGPSDELGRQMGLLPARNSTAERWGLRLRRHDIVVRSDDHC